MEFFFRVYLPRLQFGLILSLASAEARRASLRNSFTRRSIVGIATFAQVASASATSPGLAALERRNGLFPDCPGKFICVSSQDDRPQVWDNPWDTDDEPVKAMARLRKVIESKLNGIIVEADDRYLRAAFTTEGIGGTVFDDVEFYFPADDRLIQFYALRRGGFPTDFGANRQRLEQARIALGYEKVPVLRNRKLALFFGESPFDSFGPATYDATDDMGFPVRDMDPAEYRDLDPLSKPWEKPTVEMKLAKARELGWLGERESDDRARSK